MSRLFPLTDEEISEILVPCTGDKVIEAMFFRYSMPLKDHNRYLKPVRHSTKKSAHIIDASRNALTRFHVLNELYRRAVLSSMGVDTYP